MPVHSLVDVQSARILEVGPLDPQARELLVVVLAQPDVISDIVCIGIPEA